MTNLAQLSRLNFEVRRARDSAEQRAIWAEQKYAMLKHMFNMFGHDKEQIAELVEIVDGIDFSRPSPFEAHAKSMTPQERSKYVKGN